eukprot:403345562
MASGIVDGASPGSIDNIMDEEEDQLMEDYLGAAVNDDNLESPTKSLNANQQIVQQKLNYNTISNSSGSPNQNEDVHMQSASKQQTLNFNDENYRSSPSQLKNNPRQNDIQFQDYLGNNKKSNFQQQQQQLNDVDQLMRVLNNKNSVNSNHQRNQNDLHNNDVKQINLFSSSSPGNNVNNLVDGNNLEFNLGINDDEETRSFIPARDYQQNFNDLDSKMDQQSEINEDNMFPQYQNDLTNNNLTTNGDQNEDLIDRAITKLKYHLLSFGYPDPGNMRSNKKKDIKLRIKCMAAILKQRQKDLDYRQNIDQKLSRLQYDKEMFEDKHKKAVARCQEMEKEKFALQLQIKDKANEVKNTVDRQKTLNKGQNEITGKLEQRIVLLNIELKKVETQNNKLQEHIKRLMGGDKQLFANGLEVTSKVQNGLGISRNVPEREFVEQVKRGNELVIERYQHENHHLKDCLMLLQSEIKTTMDQHFIPLTQLNQAQIPLTLLDELKILNTSQFKLEQVIKPLQLNIPQNTTSLSLMTKAFNENMKKFNRFYSQILNPLTTCKIMVDINQMLAERAAASGEGNSCVYQPVTSYDELKQIIKKGTIQMVVSLGAFKNGVTANNTSGNQQQKQQNNDRGRQTDQTRGAMPSNTIHPTSKSRKKWQTSMSPVKQLPPQIQQQATQLQKIDEIPQSHQMHQQKSINPKQQQDPRSKILNLMDNDQEEDFDPTTTQIHRLNLGRQRTNTHTGATTNSQYKHSFRPN